MNCLANYRCKPDPRQDREKSSSLLFVAKSHKHAVEDALRFIRAQQRVYPNVYGELISIKVSEYKIKRVDEEGRCLTAADYPYFEWQWDVSDFTAEQAVDEYQARKG